MVFHRSLCVIALVLLGLVCSDAVFTHQSNSIRNGRHAGRRLLQSSGSNPGTIQVSDQQQQQAQGLSAVAGVPGTATEGRSPGTTAAVLKVKHKHVHEYALAVSADPNEAVTVTASPSKPVLVVEIGPAAAAAAGASTPPGDVAAAAATDGTPQQQQQQPAGSGVKASDGDGDERSLAGSSAAPAAAQQPNTPNSSSSSTGSSTGNSPSSSSPNSSSSSSPGSSINAGPGPSSTLLPAPSAAQPANLESGTAPVLIKSSSSSSVGSNGAMFDTGAGGYAYLPPTSSSSSVPLGMPVTETGLQLSRWVMVAWGVSNFSNPVMLSSDVMREVQAMINNFTSMAPGQVQLAAHANVTLALTLSDLPDDSAFNEGLLTASLSAAASEWAGGYDPAYISVTYSPPDYGVRTAQFQAASTQQVVQKDQETLVLPNGSSNSSSSGGGSGGSRRLRQSRSGFGGRGVRRVWVSYTRMAPMNATELQRRVAASCGVDALTAGLDLTGGPCAASLSDQLRDRGAPLNETGGVGLLMSEAPMVSLTIRLAVGVTEAQAAAGTDSMLAAWLAQPRNIRNAITLSGVPDPIGPNALIKWLLTPEIWVSPPPPPSGSSSPRLSTGAMVGIAVGAAAAVGLAAGLVAAAVVWARGRGRWTSGPGPAGDTHVDAASIASSRRRRRRPAKRRYLLPEVAPPVSPDTASSSAAAAAATALSSSSSADSAAAGSSDDVILTPDQIRPAMRDLGDSVTSAVRFEDDDEDDSEGLGSAEGLDPGAAAAAAAGSGAVGGSARMLTPAQRVLAAREALLAEQQDSAAAGSGLNPNSSSSSSGPSQPQGVGAGVSASGGAGNIGGWVEMGAMRTGAAAAGLGAGVNTAAAAAAVPLNPQRLHSPFGTSQAQQQQQHHSNCLPEQQQQQAQDAPSSSSTPPAPAAAAAASSVAAARRRPLSPFAVGYDMSQLAAAAPTLGSSSGAADTQQLQQ